MISPMTGSHDKSSSSEDARTAFSEEDPPRCLDCALSFETDSLLHDHLLEYHVRQPRIQVARLLKASSPKPHPPIRITLKCRREHSEGGGTFEVVSPFPPETLDTADVAADGRSADEEEEQRRSNSPEAPEETTDHESEEVTNMELRLSPESTDEGVGGDLDEKPDVEKDDVTSDYGSIPGAEPTPPPEASPDYPKIRIKSGLLKEPLTITEVTGDGEDITGEDSGDADEGNKMDGNSPHEDPLKINESSHDSGPDGSLISSLITNNFDRAKDLGFTTSDSEFISMDRFEDRNRTAMQVFNSSSGTSVNSQNPLNTLAGLPMQQLAEQVSRLQPNNGGMHQQNVLINIQQFQQPPPPPPPYQPPMYPHPPGVPPQPMYHPQYPPQYQPPPNPMYYPPAHPGYMPPPPRPPMPQQPPVQPHQQPYRQPQARPQAQHPPRQPMQRQPAPPRGIPGHRGHPPGPRHRQPVPRQRGVAPMGPRGPRPRMPHQQQQQQQQPPPQIRAVKRDVDHPMGGSNVGNVKRRRMDVLVPGKHDDADCEVIAVQPKNTGLPQIQSIQGNASEPNESNVMHLSDSITLSVRNPPVRPASPKRSDAKAVANILATRGITVTAAPKPKKPDSPNNKVQSPPPPPLAINLNNSVSILPAQKPVPTKMSNSNGSVEPPRLPTVDLTDDALPDPMQPKPLSQRQTPPLAQKVLKFQCDLCPAKYPNSMSLAKHRQSFHKTTATREFGIPLIDVRNPTVVQKLASVGIHNYIPLPAGSTTSTFGIPIVSTNNWNSGNSLGSVGLTNVLNLGPIRTFGKIPIPPNHHPNNVTHSK